MSCSVLSIKRKSNLIGVHRKKLNIISLYEKRRIMAIRNRETNQYIYPYMGEEVELKLGLKGEVANSLLIDRGKNFETSVYQITNRVYHMVGPGLSNSTMIEGDKGIIIVDTGTTIEEGQEILKKFQEVVDKPVVAVLYTHNHYSKGTRGVIPQNKGEDIEIWGHKLIHHNMTGRRSELHTAFMRRLYIQFGYFLPESGSDSLTNMGVGTEYKFNPGKVGYIQPNCTFSETQDTRIDGVEVRFIPGFSDTDDTVTIWLPEHDVVINNLMWGVFPNIGAIRGEHYRDPTKWIKSLDDVRNLNPKYLLNCHGAPILNKRDSMKAVTDYRDAIQFIYDQTVRGINNGKDPSELVETIKLPEHLTASPYIQEFYGEIQFAIRGIYSGLIGWFGHDTTELHPVSKQFEAERIVSGFGGEERMRAVIQESYDKKEYAWVAQLCNYILKINPKSKAIMDIKADSLRQMGRVSTSAITRNYYLTQALELEGKVDTLSNEIKRIRVNQVLEAPPETWINNLRFYLIPEKSISVDCVMGIKFNDIGKKFTIHVRKGILESIDYELKNEVSINLTMKVWANLLGNEITLNDAINDGDVTVTGNREEVLNFFEMLDFNWNR